MPVGVSTAHLLLPEASVSAILDALAALAPPVIELAAGGPEPLGRALLGALHHAALPVAAVEAFFPGPRPLAGPALAALDAGERAVAQRLCAQSIVTAAELGAPVVVVTLGGVPLGEELTDVRQAFERGEPAAAARARALAARRARGSAPLDAARQALEPLLRLAETAAVQLALPNRPGYDQLPDERELDRLLADFRGAPLGAWFDTGAAHVADVLGLAPPGAALAHFAPVALGVHLSDAAGLARGLAPGVGEVDFAALKDALPADAPRFVHCAPGAFPREVALALEAMRALLS
jgi:sugar phosphate isomerase/epimerase